VPGPDHDLGWGRRGIGRRVSSRAVHLPPPGPELTLRPQSPYAAALFAVLGAIGLFAFVDALGDSWGLSIGGLVVGVAAIVWAFCSFRRSTYVGSDGLRIQGAWSTRRIPWEDVEQVELLPHRPGRAERIGVVLVSGERVPLIHQDSKSLVLRPGASQPFYDGLIDRIETVRRTAGR
jgi:hypothetical protein